MIKSIICRFCKDKAYSIMDRKYIQMFGNCWSCDKKKWKNKELSTVEFERREKIALYGGE